MEFELYTAEQLADVEPRLTTIEAQAIGGRVWSWRFQSAPSAVPNDACFVIGEAVRGTGAGGPGPIRRSGGPRAWASAVRSDVVAFGNTFRAAQVIGGDLARLSGDEDFDRALYERLFDALAKSGVVLAYGAVEPRLEKHMLALGFHAAVDVSVRSLYLGLGLSRRMGRESINPLRAIAKEAARIRTKLIEVELNAENLKRFREAESLRRNEHCFAIDKSEAYLRWRYLEDPRSSYRFFIHRRRVGVGLDGYGILSLDASDQGRVEAHLMDHWSREPGRRAHAVFLGEISLWAMTEETEVLRGFAVDGSNVDQALIGMGGMRKKAERTLVVKRLGEGAPSLDVLDPKNIHLRAGDLELISSMAVPGPRRASLVG
jgi:hypothetical protein